MPAFSYVISSLFKTIAAKPTALHNVPNKVLKLLDTVLCVNGFKAARPAPVAGAALERRAVLSRADLLPCLALTPRRWLLSLVSCACSP